tara:strand:- start:801 stop:1502 length:702 start_codon:yes stop_codon:yes gene_type:complete
MISFVVPAYNEENRIEQTINEIINSCKDEGIKNIEIIVINDCSTDKTIEVLQKLNQNNLEYELRFYTNPKNLGFGGSINQGFSKSNKEYIMWIPGDNAHPASEIKKMLKYFKSNNFSAISTYYTNKEKRNFFRQLFTDIYTPFLNLVFGLKLKYYNGLTIIKRSYLNKIKIQTDAHCWQVEMWVRLKKINNFTYDFVPTLLFEDDKSTVVFKLRNSIKVLFVIFKLIIFNLTK